MDIFFLLIFSFLSLVSGHERFAREIQDGFRDIVKQKTSGNSILQCPCVLHPESRQCISYDSRYQAATIEEAMLAFIDLNTAPYQTRLVDSNSFQCISLECRTCFGLLYYRLLDVGAIDLGIQFQTPILPRSSLNVKGCRRFKFKSVPVPPPPIVPSYVKSMIAAGQRFARSDPFAEINAKINDRNNNNNNINNNANIGNIGNIATANSAVVQPRYRPNPSQTRNQNNQNRDQFRTREQDQLRTQQRQQELQQRQQQLRQQQQSKQQLRQQLRNQQQQQQQQWGRNQNQWTQQQRQQWHQQLRQQQQIRQQIQQQQQWQQQWQQWQNQQYQQQWNNQLGNSQNGNNGFSQPPPWYQLPWLSSLLGNLGLGGLGGIGGLGGGGIGAGVGGGGSVVEPVTPITLPSGGGGTIIFIKRRKRRQSKLQPKSKKKDDSIVGQRFTVACTNRGESEDELLSLCGSCWTWRQLPEEYFPRLLNELSCKEDDYCLSGWGTCSQQFRNVDVLRRQNGNWVPTVITTATCCDCKVKAGTEIHSLVVGDKRSG